MSQRSPFLEVRSFVAEEAELPQFETASSPASPFLSVYELEDGGRVADSRADEYMLAVNELHDEEFEEALFALVNEATAIHDARVSHEYTDPRAGAHGAERLLEQHFAPLANEAQAMLAHFASEFGRRDPSTFTANEIDTVIDRYEVAAEHPPAFEQFLKSLKKVAKKAVSLAKKGISAAAKFGLGPILEKLKGLIKPLLKRVIQTAIGKLPVALQPAARKLAGRLPFLKEVEEGHEHSSEETCEVAQIHAEFDQRVAELLFAENEAQLELELSEALIEQQTMDVYPVHELDHARQQFVQDLRRLREGEDPTPHVENFVPAILPALRIGIRLVGRKRVVDFLAKLLGKLIQRFVGPQFAPALSQAIVDAGLRLISLETTAEDEAEAAASAVAATVEETVRRVAALPDYVLDDQELLEGFALEAFEQAAAANLPPVLPEETYRKRPQLSEARKLRGTWIQMPRGRRKRYKKFSRRIPVRIMPHNVAAVESFEGVPLAEFLEEEVGIAAGEEIEAFAHLYEAIPGTTLSRIARLEEHTPGLGMTGGYEQLHPLTEEAAAMLFGEPALGRGTAAEHSQDPHTPEVGERFYYLEIPGRRLLTTPPEPGSPARVRRPTQIRLTFDFPKDEIRMRFFLSEVRAQEIAVKLRQQAHVGAVVAHLRGFLDRGLRRSLSGAFGRLKVIHERATPGAWAQAFRRLPSFVPRVLLGRLQEWVVAALSDNLKQRSDSFLQAADNTADGVTVVITLANAPGLAQLRQALGGKPLSIAGLALSGAPRTTVEFVAGYARE